MEDCSGKPEPSPPSGQHTRVPPGQYTTTEFPVLHEGPVPSIDLNAWRFRVFGAVEEAWEMTYDEFQSLPKTEIVSDFHCVTRWSRLDNRWEGVSSREVMKRCRLKPGVRYVMVHADGDYTTNLDIAAFLEDDVLFAYRHDGKDLTPEHGWPLRLVVPKRYAWKSAKWVNGLEFMMEDRRGFWEQAGYHMRGDPWLEERHREG